MASAPTPGQSPPSVDRGRTTAGGETFVFGAFELDLGRGREAAARWTPGFKALFGLAGDEDLPLDEDGLPAGIHPDDRAQVHARIRAAVDSKGPGTLQVQLRSVGADGTTRWLLLLAQVFAEAGGHRRLSGVGLDTGAHHHVQQAHARLLREQAVLADFSLRARSATDVQAICEATAAVLARSMDVAFSQLFEFLPEAGTLLIRAVAGWGHLPARATRLSADPVTPAGLALRLRGPVILNDVHADPRFDLPAYMRVSGVTSSMAVVIPTGDPPFGVLAVDSTTEYAFTESDLQFLQSIANVLAATIVRIRSEERWHQEDTFTTVALNTSTTLMTVVDRAGRLIRFSPACERLTGYAAEEALGRPISEFVPPEEREEAARAIAGLSRGKDGAVLTYERHWLTKTGERRLIAWSATALRDRAGEVQYVVGTGLDITDRKRLEREILAIAEHEQRRIGSDLHDDLGQRLAAIQFLTGNLQEDLADASPAVAELVGRIAVMAREAYAHTRMLARGLSPAILDSIGLLEALRKLARNTTALFRVNCECRADQDHDFLAPEAAIHFYRIAQEAVGNTLKHAQAKQIVIEVFPQGRCELRVTDDGVGFFPDAVQGEGMGLQSMRYRASLFGGRVSIRSRPGEGTQLVCEFSPWVCHPPGQG